MGLKIDNAEIQPKDVNEGNLCQLKHSDAESEPENINDVTRGLKSSSMILKEELETLELKRMILNCENKIYIENTRKMELRALRDNKKLKLDFETEAQHYSNSINLAFLNFALEETEKDFNVANVRKQDADLQELKDIFIANMKPKYLERIKELEDTVIKLTKERDFDVSNTRKQNEDLKELQDLFTTSMANMKPKYLERIKELEDIVRKLTTKIDSNGVSNLEDGTKSYVYDGETWTNLENSGDSYNDELIEREVYDNIGEVPIVKKSNTCKLVNVPVKTPTMVASNRYIKSEKAVKIPTGSPIRGGIRRNSKYMGPGISPTLVASNRNIKSEKAVKIPTGSPIRDRIQRNYKYPKSEIYPEGPKGPLGMKGYY